MKRYGLELSHESEYLRERGWWQLALLGYFTDEEMSYVLSCLRFKDTKAGPLFTVRDA
jgi:hypothetical protein